MYIYIYIYIINRMQRIFFSTMNKLRTDTSLRLKTLLHPPTPPPDATPLPRPTLHHLQVLHGLARNRPLTPTTLPNISSKFAQRLSSATTTKKSTMETSTKSATSITLTPEPHIMTKNFLAEAQFIIQVLLFFLLLFILSA